MGKRIILTLLLLLLFCSPAFAFGPMLGQSKTVSDGLPAGTLLVGDDIQYSTAEHSAGGDDFVSGYGTAGKVAVASADIAKGHVWLSSWWACGAGEYIKMIVYQVSDGSLVAESTALECGTQSVTSMIEFDFTSGSIVSGTAYHLGIIPQETVKLMHNNDGTAIVTDTTGTLTTPNDPIAVGTIIRGLMGGMYVTN